MSQYVSPVSVVIPAYNEHGGIAEVLDRVRAAMDATGAEYEIVVVDDGSTDNTAEQVGGPKVKLLRHHSNRGYGAALKTGVRKASHPNIAIIDADGTYPAEDLPRLMENLGDADMVVGARIGDEVSIPLARRPAKWFITRLASLLIGSRIPDLNSGLRLFRRQEALRFINLYPDGFSFTTTITLCFLANSLEVVFLPINYFPRVGSSKIKPIQDTLRFVSTITRTVMYFKPLKVFGPVSLALLGVGFIKGLYDVIAYSNLKTSDMLLLVSGLVIGAIGLLGDLIDKRG